MQIKKIKAITLVEVLVVLTIIGVVTALTIPGLKRHSQRTENAKLAQKGYAVLEQAVDYAVATKGKDFDELNFYKASQTLEYIAPYMVKAVDLTSESKEYKNFKQTAGSSSQTALCLTLSDGINICAAKNNRYFYIDVNGSAEPNMEGVDMFKFQFARFDSDCELDNGGQWKFCPASDQSKKLMEDNWTITYW